MLLLIQEFAKTNRYVVHDLNQLFVLMLDKRYAENERNNFFHSRENDNILHKIEFDLFYLLSEFHSFSVNICWNCNGYRNKYLILYKIKLLFFIQKRIIS